VLCLFVDPMARSLPDFERFKGSRLIWPRGFARRDDPMRCVFCSPAPPSTDP
jgi:hypothetical protein